MYSLVDPGLPGRLIERELCSTSVLGATSLGGDDLHRAIFVDDVCHNADSLVRG